MAQPVTVRPSPPPNPAPFPGTAPPAPPRSWRGVAVRARERFFIGVAAVAAGVAMFWSVMSVGYSLMLQSAATLPSESTLHLWTWQYRITGGGLVGTAQWVTPPLLIVGLLIVAGVLMDLVSPGLVAPIRRAQGKFATVRWAAGGARARMKAELHAAGYAGFVRSSGRVLLLVATALVGAAGLLSFALPLQDGFTRGVGPVVIGLAALVTVVSTLAATPWSHWPTVVLLGDGTLTIDGHEPLAEVIPLPVPTSALPAAAPPPAYPKAAGESYPPPPPPGAPPPPPPPHPLQPF